LFVFVCFGVAPFFVFFVSLVFKLFLVRVVISDDASAPLLVVAVVFVVFVFLFGFLKC
jgi:hypothetical protein